MSTRIITADAGEWITHHAPPGAIVTSLPDWDEVYDAYPDIGRYLDQFDEWASICIRHAAKGGYPAVFFQTDRLHAGRWIDKAVLITQAAEYAIQAGDARIPVVWHKIVLRRDPGKVDLFRPTYSHLIAVSPTGPGPRTCDVIPHSPSLYPNGTPTLAAYAACVYAKRYAPLIIDPFCGHGTIPRAAADLGVETIGVDLDPEMVAFAEHTMLPSTLFPVTVA